MFKRREYIPQTHDGVRLIFWRWRNIYTPGSTEVYMRRLYVLRISTIGSVMLNWLLKPDSDRWLHSHPWWFCSFVLRGGYTETVPDPDAGPLLSYADRWRERRYIRWFNFKGTADAHMIVDVFPRTLTLVFTGPKVQSWGFFTPKGFVNWRQYLDQEFF